MHDWSLVSIAINWPEGKAALVVLDCSSAERVISFSGLRELTLDRMSPWGPSNSINEYRLAKYAGGVSLEMEMQSGDIIKVRAQEIGGLAS